MLTNRDFWKVRAVRDVVHTPNKGFMRQLYEFEKKMGIRGKGARQLKYAAAPNKVPKRVRGSDEEAIGLRADSPSGASHGISCARVSLGSHTVSSFHDQINPPDEYLVQPEVKSSDDVRSRRNFSISKPGSKVQLSQAFVDLCSSKSKGSKKDLFCTIEEKTQRSSQVRRSDRAGRISPTSSIALKSRCSATKTYSPPTGEESEADTPRSQWTHAVSKTNVKPPVLALDRSSIRLSPTSAVSPAAGQSPPSIPEVSNKSIMSLTPRREKIASVGHVVV